MVGKLLITLREGDVTRSFSFDGSAQTALWLGMARKVSADNALAHLESEGDALTLYPVGIGKSKARGKGIPVPPLAEFVTSIERPGERTVYFFSRPVLKGMGTYRKLGFSDSVSFIVGRSQGSGFLYESPFVSSQHARIEYADGSFTLTDLDSSNGTIINGQPLTPLQPRWLKVGDVVQILDLVFAVGQGFLSINTPPRFSVKVPGVAFVTHQTILDAWADVDGREDELDVFYPAPRLSKSIHPLKMQVDDPPAKKEQDDQPVIMQIGPSFLMGLSSVFMITNSVSQIANGANVMTAMPSIAMAVAMVGGSVVWPVISRAYNRKRDEREEARRGSMYVSYLDSVETRLANEASVQAQTLRENRRPIQELLDRADNLSPLLMSHTSVHDDFMDLRVGVGDADISSEVNWPQRHFTLADDRMLDKVTNLSKNPPMLRDVPIAFNPVEHFIAGILGERAEVWEFLRGLIVQVCALYSYQEVKLVVIGNEEEMGEWDFLRGLGHLYDDSGTHRLVALSYSGMIEEGLLIERELEARAQERAEVLADYGTYYVVICADPKLAERSEAIGRLAKLRSNRGFSLLYLGRDLRDLPRECGYIIDLTPDGGTNLGISLDMTREDDRQRPRRARMFERADVSGTLRQFDPDVLVSREQAVAFARGLARVHLDIPEQRSQMPESVGFLEMFEVSNVSHLNIGQRWVENDASQSLQTQVGIDEQGEPAYLNLHQNIHGPHGLIAGTTGSGKSEFIITYILSLCANYAPDEVAFVLIDYKGGGLAGAFDNDRHHLPHLAGTITNLDGGAIKRSLVSIQSELRRRQDMFNKACDITGEATIDIYKYLSYYRQGVLSEPLPHLFIVADEFAELKQQEPEFMDELISAARIGRSLGVHLILATQKPSGVVNDQIWSNSRFKVCLKVSDASDSREMIQRDDAAEITQAGRYYLLVGYNESFSAGQAAYAGAPYAPSEHFEPKRDNAVDLIDNEGETIARMRPQVTVVRQGGSEIEAVIGQIEEAARITGKYAHTLWLDPLPNHISLLALERKYGPIAPEGLTVVLGEVDDPDNQNQFRHTFDLAAVGNVALYGSQASGVEGLLETMLFSLCAYYGPKDLWIYGVDLGAGLLSELSVLPQVGGVVLPNDDERLENLIRMLEETRKERQHLLSSYGGNLDTYNQRSGKHLPRIVVAMANIASFTELYPDYEDTLVSLTREGPRYGIHFVITASTANAVRMRLGANFGMAIPTMLNDTSDYLTILGSIRDVTPPQQERRGLVKVGKRVLEFQGVSISEPGEETAPLVEALAQGLRRKTKAQAAPIPQLPAYVTCADMGDAATKRRLPVGYAKRGIEPVFFDLKKSPYMLVLANDNDPIDRYLRGVRESLALAGNVNYRFVDPHGLLGSVSDTNVLTTIDEVEAFVERLDAGEEDVDVVVFTSIAQTMTSLSSTVSRKLQDYLAGEKGAGKVSFVCASEAWRVKSIYDNWYKVISAYGNGIWCGSGFVDQTVFRFSRSLPEYRQVAERSDGFLVMRGEITWVRLLEAADEPKDLDGASIEW